MHKRILYPHNTRHQHSIVIVQQLLCPQCFWLEKRPGPIDSHQVVQWAQHMLGDSGLSSHWPKIARQHSVESSHVHGTSLRCSPALRERDQLCHQCHAICDLVHHVESMDLSFVIFPSIRWKERMVSINACTNYVSTVYTRLHDNLH